jgi:hypothetical protein
LTGSYHESRDHFLNIGSEIYNNVFTHLISENDILLIFIVTLLLTYNNDMYMLIVKLTNNLVYNYFEDNNIFQMFDNYSKCRYDIIVENFEEIKPSLCQSAYISNYINTINYEFKNNILKEIINNSSCVSIAYIAQTIKEDTEVVKTICCENINAGFPAKIDDIDNLIYSRKTNKMTETLNKTIDFCNMNYLRSVNKIIANVSAHQPKLKDEDYSDKQVIHLEKKLERGNSGQAIHMEKKLERGSSGGLTNY